MLNPSINFITTQASEKDKGRGVDIYARMQIDISLAWDLDKDIDTRICSNAKQGLDLDDDPGVHTVVRKIEIRIYDISW